MAAAGAKNILIVEPKPESEIWVPVPQTTAIVCGTSELYK